MIQWNLFDLKEWIANGCDFEIAKSVDRLNINNTQLFEIPKEIGQLINLTHLSCASNLIIKIPKEIEQLVNLTKFDCAANQILELPKEIEQLVNLTDFNCFANQIIELPKEIGQLINLITFNCSGNQIIELPKEIGQLINLEQFYCNHNKISEISKEIRQLINLKRFYCNYNNITEIPREIGQLTNLAHFSCLNNKIKGIPIEIINCKNLIYFNYSNNEIEYIPPQVQRWFNRHNYIQKIYNDEQSVHNHNIQQCISNSINYITKFKPTLNIESLKTHILNNNLLEEQTKQLLFEYCEDATVHSVLNITFEELLISVYDFILNHKDKDEIFAVVNKEMTDSLCKCFTGRITRLINSLNGFDDNIVINISDAEQIGNIFIMIKQNLELEEKYSDDLFKEIVTKELQERNYDEATIKQWIDNI
ncbi:leucine rich repeat protein [Bodo saltans virus]|jgi:Leucine-rich repeat (LRR) protein|uniref:Leucine rich repeat protein n=1 Tax=Bodo saltans virus TaxID=2024608 RepID=A0A2H4UUS3_9VIRU|nr:leucine rich repeat protein [Bodo saltans virus]ATZ80670.1 leucine rich repeat protein [Bodo saltans virus]